MTREILFDLYLSTVGDSSIQQDRDLRIELSVPGSITQPPRPGQSYASLMGRIPLLGPLFLLSLLTASISHPCDLLEIGYSTFDVSSGKMSERCFKINPMENGSPIVLDISSRPSGLIKNISYSEIIPNNEEMENDINIDDKKEVTSLDFEYNEEPDNQTSFSLNNFSTYFIYIQLSPLIEGEGQLHLNLVERDNNPDTTSLDFKNLEKLDGISKFVNIDDQQRSGFYFDCRDHNPSFFPAKYHMLITNLTQWTLDDYIQIDIYSYNSSSSILVEDNPIIKRSNKYMLSSIVDLNLQDDSLVFSPIHIELSNARTILVITPSSSLYCEFMYLLEPDISPAKKIKAKDRIVTLSNFEHPSYHYIEFASSFHDVELNFEGSNLKNNTTIIVYNSNCGRKNSKSIFFNYSGCNLQTMSEGDSRNFTITIENPGECQYVKIIAEKDESEVMEGEIENIMVRYEYISLDGFIGIIVLGLVLFFTVIIGLILYLIGIGRCAVKRSKNCCYIVANCKRKQEERRVHCLGRKNVVTKKLDAEKFMDNTDYISDKNTNNHGKIKKRCNRKGNALPSKGSSMCNNDQIVNAKIDISTYESI